MLYQTPQICYNCPKGENIVINPEEEVVKTNNFLKKLLSIINNEASFTLFKTKFISKIRIDDITCCIEGSFPKEYKVYGKKRGERKLNSKIVYTHLKEVVKHKFPLTPDQYLVDYKEAIQTITTFMAAYERDIKLIYKEGSDMS